VRPAATYDALGLWTPPGHMLGEDFGNWNLLQGHLQRVAANAELGGQRHSALGAELHRVVSKAGSWTPAPIQMASLHAAQPPGARCHQFRIDGFQQNSAFVLPNVLYVSIQCLRCI
jgi:hypothetical protein